VKFSPQHSIKYWNASLVGIGIVVFLSVIDVIKGARNELEKNEKEGRPDWPERTVDRIGKNSGKMAMRPVQIDSLSRERMPGALSRSHRFSKSASSFFSLSYLINYLSSYIIHRYWLSAVICEKREETSMPGVPA